MTNLPRIEKGLWKFRYFMLIVIFFLLLSFLLLLIIAGNKLVMAVQGIMYNVEFNIVLSQVIDVLDISLICVILLLIAWGLYEMFINKLDVGAADQLQADAVFIHNIDDLKTKLGKVIVISFVVHAFKQFLIYDITGALDMLMMSCAVVLIAAALYLTSKM